MRNPGFARRRLRALRQAASERVIAWSMRRHGADLGSVTISRRRVYILPTGLGIAFAAMLFAMLLGGLNYGNNLALALTFLLAASGWVAMHQCHRNLAGLTLAPAGTRAPSAGEAAEFGFALSAPYARTDLLLKSATHAATPVSIADGETATAHVQLATLRRGRVRLERLRV